MKRCTCLIIVTSLFAAYDASSVMARGGRGGGRGPGGGMSRPTTNRSPSMSRSASPKNRSTGGSGRNISSSPNKAARPNRPDTPSRQPATGGKRPATGGKRPAAGTRPGSAAGGRPSQQPSSRDVQKFLDLGDAGAKRPATRPGAGASGALAGGGAAAAFLDKGRAGDQTPETSDNIRGRIDGNSSKPGERVEEGRLPGRDDEIATRDIRRPNDDQQQRPENMRGLAENQPVRIENRDERIQQRQDRRDEIREQYPRCHPRRDFWKEHPHWARWRWTRPYGRVTWGYMTTWFPYNWNQPITYNYGDDIYYQGDTVYYEEEPVASAEEYATQASDLAIAAPEPAEDSQWLSLGVFALTQDGQSSGPPPTLFLQLAVDKEGIIAGTVTNRETEQTLVIEGMVDKETQRSAWVIEGKDSPIMETGLSNLTNDEAPALLHFASGETQQWLMVRVEEPENPASDN